MKKLISLFLITVIFSVPAFTQEEKEKTKSKEEYIADLVSDSDEKTILAAAQWAGEKKVKEAIPNLIKLLSDKRENVRSDAAAALGYIGQDQEDAIQALNQAMLEDESPIVRYAAVLATMRIGSKKSLDALKQSYEQETDPYIKDLLEKVREQAKK